MKKFFTKERLMDTLGLGILFWIIGYLLGMILFPFISIEIMGWFILAILVPIMIYVALKRFKKREELRYFYVIIAVTWVLIPILFDYIFLVKSFNVENYYDLDLSLYYFFTFIIPLVIGFKYGKIK